MQQGGVTRPHDTARKGHDTTSPRVGVCGLAGGGVVIQKLYRGWGVTVGVVIQRNQGLRYGAEGCDMRSSVRDMVRSGHEARNCVAIQFCIVTEGSCDTALQHMRARNDTAGHACDMTGRRPLYGPVRTTTWRHAHGLGAMRAARELYVRSLGSGCAPCAPNPVLTQCTVLSHCLGHCS